MHYKKKLIKSKSLYISGLLEITSSLLSVYHKHTSFFFSLGGQAQNSTSRFLRMRANANRGMQVDTGITYR